MNEWSTGHWLYLPKLTLPNYQNQTSQNQIQIGPKIRQPNFRVNSNQPDHTLYEHEYELGQAPPDLNQITDLSEPNNQFTKR